MQNHDHDHGQSAGNLKISRDVLATIARYATMEIEGVASLGVVYNKYSRLAS